MESEGFFAGHLAIGGGLDRAPPNSNSFNDGRSIIGDEHVLTHASGASQVIAEAAPRVPRAGLSAIRPRTARRSELLCATTTAPAS
jgi:hypothetical protein